MLLSCTFSLPGGFAYLVNEIYLSWIVNTASDVSTAGHWRLSGSSAANQGFDYRIPFLMTLFSQNGSTLGVRASEFSAGRLTRTPIVPRSEGATQSVSVANLADPAMAAGVLDFVASFWEYDLEQAQFFPVHSANNVVGR